MVDIIIPLCFIKNKKMGIGENIMKYWKYYALLTALITGGGWLYTQGGQDKEFENRIFKTEKMRYETERYMEQKPNAAQEQRAFFRDSVNTANAIKSRAKRDSTYKSEIEARKLETKARKRTDSIVLLNADQLFQIKEQLKRINN